jgi:tripartite-type tricarboxylate transporter receptor subunit TctC
MQTHLKICAVAVASFAAWTVAISSADAEAEYPQRAIKFVVPVPPGGTADALPRLIAEKLQRRWGQPVTIENRPGAALNLAAEAVAKAAPDGYTLLTTPSPPLATNQFLYPNLPFDPGAFVPITILARGPFVLIVRSSLAVSTLQEFLAFARKNPDRINFATSGVGSPGHLALEMLKAKALVRAVHVPYKGLTPALNDVAAGHVDAMFHDLASVQAPLLAGRVKLIAVGSESRIPDMPDVPAVAELVPGFLSQFWYAMVAPPRTPPGITAKVSQAVAETLRTPEIVKWLREFSIAPGGTTPAQTASFLAQERARWREIILTAGIKGE